MHFFRPNNEPYRTLYDALAAQQEKRDSDPDWESNERQAIHEAAIKFAESNGLHSPTIQEVCRAERYAVGHCDYTAQFAYAIGRCMLEKRNVMRDSQ